jgi:branched-chain amino acid transport system permease protein
VTIGTAMRMAGERIPRRVRSSVAWIALIAAVALWPLLYDNAYYLSIGIIASIYIMLGVGMNMLMGHAGLIHAGFAAFFGIGAYVVAIVTTKFELSFWLALPAAAILSAVIAVVIGIPAIRVSGIYFVLVTLGFGEIFRIIAANSYYTGGPNGLYGIPAPSVAGFGLGSTLYLYWLVLAVVVLSLFAMHRLSNSRIGRAWDYLRQDETAAAALGVDPVWGKLQATLLGGLWAGIGGAWFAVRQTAVAPSSFTFFESFVVILVIAIGGLRSLPGVIVGTFAMIVLPEVLRPLQQYRLIIFGAAIIVMMLYRPEGLLPGKAGKRYADIADEMVAGA